MRIRTGTHSIDDNCFEYDVIVGFDKVNRPWPKSEGNRASIELICRPPHFSQMDRGYSYPYIEPHILSCGILVTPKLTSTKADGIECHINSIPHRYVAKFVLVRKSNM